MSLGIARDERRELCDLLTTLGPSAPTLCEGWDAQRLTAHLHVRETDPVAGIGIVVKPLSGRLDRRMDQLLADVPFDDLVALVRRGPGRFNPMSWPWVDERVNALEFFVHHEDLRRGGGHVVQPRIIAPDRDDWLWHQAVSMARLRLRRSPTGVVLERIRDGVRTDEVYAVSTGPSPVTLRGEAGELVLWLYGRSDAAHVTLDGRPEAVEALRGMSLGI
ncbi:TIGR03085 family metal-binding protein [Brooklawnia cerclae]|uniref:Uncharacterized protein (TIGR03085 family) n=1 Tax=Brooklawnia cerclae TaxID=349934 RepID=A0ABX0SJZ2_9ACTN|nr:TIGR03085 family metal-binding protein [Brooklawnia cerclae]NIH58244.1 uncharacterized protein (TIGR03085 family) [Brooklawnia cerclae]